MEAPPKSMRKGFDQALARALQTTTSVLFLSWVVHSPESLERTIPGTDFFRGNLVGQVLLFADERHLSGDHFDQFLQELSWGLTKEEADEMVAYIEKVVLAKHDVRYEAFRLIADKIELFEDGSRADVKTRRNTQTVSSSARTPSKK